MKTVSEIITGIFDREGRGYTNNPNDKGGPTKFGITLATLAAYRRKQVTATDVSNLKEFEAREIYQDLYVNRPGFDRILSIDFDVGIELIDTGVNMGVDVAGTFLQRVLNVFNARGRFYPDLKVDGSVGEKTASALVAYLARRRAEGSAVMVKALNALQGARYVELAEKREANEDFVYGWIRERA